MARSGRGNRGRSHGPSGEPHPRPGPARALKVQPSTCNPELLVPNLQPSTSLRIALLDPDEATHTAVREAIALHRDGWSVNIHSTLHAARRILDSPRCPDMVLMDQHLLGRSGANYIGELRDRRADLPVLILTRRFDANEISASLMGGACGCLVKPLAPCELMAAISGAAAGRLVLCREAELVVLDLVRGMGKAARDSRLSWREQQMVTCLAEGLAEKDIGRRAGIATGTVHSYLKRLYRKLYVHDRAGAVRKVFGLRAGL